MYPIIIRQSRYSGVYEGGRWFAYHEGMEIGYGYYEYIYGDDDDAVEFWGSYEAGRFGVGNTPNDALEDMCKKNKITHTYLD